jgi:hypothetical protein
MADDIDISVAVSAIGLLKLLLRYVLLSFPCKDHSNWDSFSKLMLPTEILGWPGVQGWGRGSLSRGHLLITY